MVARAAAATAGGVLWMVYGPLTMLRPWGVDVVFNAAQGYSVVVDRRSFVAYNLPGSLALALTALGLLGVTAHLRQRRTGMEQTARWLAYVAVGLGVISLVGVALVFDPVFTAGRIFGTLALGVATVAASVAAHQWSVDSGWVALLGLVGLIGTFLLPLWPLVYMLNWVTEGAAALVIALFGIGWLVVGLRLWREADRANASDVPAADPEVGRTT